MMISRRFNTLVAFVFRWSVGVWLCGSVAASANEPAFSHRSWTRDDGLPSNSAERVLQTRDGWVWVGTRDGLAPFDGVRFTVYDAKTPGFTSDAVLDLAEGVDGSLWIATKRGLYCKQGGRFTRFTTSDGLLHDYVNQIAASADGSVWLATKAGVNRLSGHRFTGFPFSETVALMDGHSKVVRDIMTLVLTKEDAVWVGTQGGLWQLETASGRYRRDSPARISTDNSNHDAVHYAWAGSNGTLWIGADDWLLQQRANGWQEFRFPPDVGDLRVRRIHGDAAGNLWVVRGGKLFRLASSVTADGDSVGSRSENPSSRDGPVELSEPSLLGDSTLLPFEDGFGLADAFVADATLDVDGRLWVATRYAGLHCLQPAPLRLFTKRDGLCDNAVSSVSPARDGGVWVATEHGVMRYRENRFEFPTVDVDLRDVATRSVFEDSTGDVWLSKHPTFSSDAALPRGVLWLERFDEGYRRLITEVATLEASAFFEDRLGRLWIAGRQGLTCLLTNYMESVPNQLLHSRRMGADVYRKRATRWFLQGDIAVRSAGVPLLEVLAGKWRHIEPQVTDWRPLDEAPPELVADLPFPADQRFSSQDIRAILETHDGALWFGTWGGGLDRLKDGKLSVLTARDGLASDQIHCLHEDSHGVLWIGTTRALNRLAPPFSSLSPRLTSFTRTHGLPDDEVHQILQDDNGQFWIGCGEGIYRVARDDLEAVAEGRASRVECPLLNSDDGLIAGQTRSGFQPSACKTPDGRLWFATPQGLARIDPETVQRRPSSPRVFLESVRTADTNRLLLDAAPSSTPAWRGGAERREGDKLGALNPPLSLSPGSGHSLSIEFTALDYAAPKRLRFRHRLAGHDPDWVDGGYRRAAFYTNLKPGSYRFDVQAASRDSLWTDSGVHLAITIAPYYWQTLWFRAAMVVALSVALAAGFWWRLRQIKLVDQAEAAAALARQREHLARDLHDDLGSRLAQISLLGELSVRDPEQATRLSAVARDAAQSLDRLVWTVHPERDSLDHLAVYLRQFACEFLGPTGVDLELDFPARLPSWPLSAAARKAVLLATKEALHNVIQHAAARRVCMTLRVSAEGFKLSIEDDGRGLPSRGQHEGASDGGDAALSVEDTSTCALPSGHGLENMRRRLAEIDGRFEIGPGSGGGTLINLIVPVSTHSS